MAIFSCSIEWHLYTDLTVLQFHHFELKCLY